MFYIPRTNVIESTEGFSVEVLGRVGLRYREGPRSMKIDSEVMMGPSGLVIYERSITGWDPPHTGDVVDDAKREAIVDNIRRAFRFRGYEIDVC